MATIVSSSKLERQSESSTSQFATNLDMDNNNSMNSIASSSVDVQNGDNSNSDFPPVIQPTVKIDIPRISTRDLYPQRPHSPCQEYEQYGYLFNGHGYKREPNKIVLKHKNLELEEGVKRAKKFALEQSVRFVLIKQQQQQQKQQLDLIKKQQALLLMCRIYVGSIFYEVKEESVRTSFSAFGPIRSISMSWDAATNKHKGFAFIEFETPEAAQLALEQMNGALLGGRNIKVGRPSNMPQAQPIIDQLTDEAKNYNRIYVASIHSELTEQDVQSVFEAFGTIRSSSLVRDPQTGKHKGYGFIEYETTQAAQDAIASMNLFDLGGQFLRVGKAVTPPEGIVVAQQPAANQLPTASALAAASITAQLQAQESLETTPAGALSILNAQNVLNNTLVQSTFSGYAPTVASSASAVLGIPLPTVTATSAIPAPVTTTIPTPAPIPAPKVATSTASPLQQALQAAQSVNSVIQNVPSKPKETPTTPTSVSQAAAPVAPTQQQQQQQPQQQQQQLQGLELTENQKQLLGMTNVDDPTASLEQQVELTLRGKDQRLMLMQKLMQRKQESKVLILRNMVGPEDVDEYLEGEITDECGKYGEVDQVIIYKEKQSDEDDDSDAIVKIFVEFFTQQSANAAMAALNGRFFGGRVVKAEIYDQGSFNAKDYSG